MEHWIEHRRADGELVGWIRPVGEHFVTIDRLGLEDPTLLDWVAAEERLEERGIGWLADPYELVQDETAIPVRITDVTGDAVVVRTEDFGDITASVETFRLPFPAPPQLRPRTTAAQVWAG